MLKKISALLCVFLVWEIQSVLAQFPYYESFKNSTAPDIVFGGQPTAFLTSGKFDPLTGGTDAVGDGYLRLTTRQQNQRGFVHNKTSFSSEFGLRIDFEYYTYGGAQFGASADGITFFLYDAAVTDANFKIGGFGGSLGYAQYQTNNDPAPIDGVTGGYLAIGLDEYGNFSNPTELRVGGPGLLKSSVTLRGRGAGSGPTIPNSTLGNYRYLIHKQTIPEFSIISGGARMPDPTHVDYRKAIIDLKPAKPLSGYYITVKIVTGGTTQTTHTVIDNHYYPDAAPAQVRYGLASSTGFEFNYHEIRNLRINAFDPIPPVANDDLNNTTPKNTPLDIAILNNDVDQNGDIDPATVTIVSNPPSGATITKNTTTGVIRYTPPLGFAGKDVFTYTVKDKAGISSNTAKIEVQVVSVKPIGADDNAVTNINTPVNINVQSNDPTKIDVSILPPLVSAKGGIIVLNADGTFQYTPPKDYFGNDTFTYKLRTNGDNLESDAITVTVTIASPPVANNDTETTEMDTPVDLNIADNDKDFDGTVVKSSIVIKTPPSNGSLGAPNGQGTVIYTPKPGFVGTDSFTYTIKDDKGFESAPATVTINVTSVPKIGLAKGLISARNGLSGSFVVRFLFTVGNYGKEPLEKVAIKDDLATAFPGTQFKIISVTPTGTLKANANYNGVGDINLLDPGSTLAIGAVETVELVMSVTMLSAGDGSYQNNSIAEGISTLNGKKATDGSVAGAKPDPNAPGDISPNGPTFVTLKPGPLYIPEGFSPNNDGINDVFIVSNSQGKSIELEVFNRWGNRVYKSAGYKNDWDGKCTEGLFLGQDLPVGTYYYVIVIDAKDKFMGYITINR